MQALFFIFSLLTCLLTTQSFAAECPDSHFSIDNADCTTSHASLQSDHSEKHSSNEPNTGSSSHCSGHSHCCPSNLVKTTTASKYLPSANHKFNPKNQTLPLDRISSFFRPPQLQI